MRRLITVVAIVVACAALGYASEAPAERISIESSWGGLCFHDCPRSTVIKCNRTVRSWNCKQSGEPVRDSAVDALVRATSVKAPRFSLALAGFDNAHIESIARRSASLVKGNLGITAAQIQTARSIAASPVYVRHYVTQSYTNEWLKHTDDYPEVAITITLSNGHRIFITSRSQQDFMLPWVIGENGNVRTSYNVEITRAIVALLPKTDPNYDRLTTASSIEWGIAQAAENDAVK